MRTTNLIRTAIAGTLLGGVMLSPSVSHAGAESVAPSTNPITVADPGPSAEVIPGRYIVRLKAGRSPRAVAAGVRAAPRHVFERAANGFDASLNETQLDALRRDASVEAIEPDQVVHLAETRNMLNGEPWGLDRIDQSARPLTGTFTWDNSGPGGGARAVTAYVIDSGIDGTGVDFLDAMYPSRGSRVRTDVDYVGGVGPDCNGHGTHVAGILGGDRYGVAKAVKLRSVRVLDCTGAGTLGNEIAAVEWARVAAAHPAVANISIGSVKSATLDTAVNNLALSGVFVSVSAGNDSNKGTVKDVDACTKSPAGASLALTVAASDINDNRASFSNVGPCVDLYAPGVNILSDAPGGGTALMSGTSMAAPHVAGVAALLKARNGDAPTITVNEWITGSATYGTIGGNPTDTANRLLFSTPSTQMRVDGTGELSAKNSIDFGTWSVETSGTDVRAIAGDNALQMLLDANGDVWTKNLSVGTFGWVRETVGSRITAIATGNGVRMALDWKGDVAAKTGPLGTTGWTQETVGSNIVAMSTGSGVQMVLGADGSVAAKTGPLGTMGWTLETKGPISAIATDGGLQMVLNTAGDVWAKTTIGFDGFTQETAGSHITAIATGDGVQMALDSKRDVAAKTGPVGTMGWTQETVGSNVVAMSTDNGVQMVLSANGNVAAKTTVNNLGTSNWVLESTGPQRAIVAA